MEDPRRKRTLCRKTNHDGFIDFAMSEQINSTFLEALSFALESWVGLTKMRFCTLKKVPVGKKSFRASHLG